MREKRSIKWGIGLLGFAFVMAGLGKFLFPFIEENFNRWGFPQEMRILIGTTEILGGLLMMLPRWTVGVCILLGTIVLGAVGVHVYFGEWKDVPLAMIYLVATLWAIKVRWSVAFSRNSANSDYRMQKSA